MHFERHGAGARAFLALHGWGADRSVFAPLAAHVPAGASLYAADLPGCGASPRPREWSVGAIVAEVVETIRALDAGRVTLVGHCGGAVFAMLAARQAPRLVGRVVAIDPFAYLPRYFRLFTGEGFGRRAYEATFANTLGRWLTNKTLNAGRDGRADLTASFGSADHEAARGYLVLFASIEGVEVFRGLRAEVELVYGERTFGAVKRSVGMFKGVLPHARAIRLAGARHMPLTEVTAQLARVVFEPEEVSGESGREGRARAKESGVGV
ncbi:MAG TPA: alpha/beta fold hydrolase [Pyrinomonadaceae bacterium]|nr:alpha/beta fold hydrolase [Pyrinomonadaceae bacterium]